MFVDEVEIIVKAGDGGNGCLAFRREKYVSMGGPFGGNGGRGANIVFKVDEGLNTLIDLRNQKVIQGKRGRNGEGKGRHGKKAEDIIVRVPLGTIVIDKATNLIIADLVKKDDEVIIANGGRGGRGNIALATNANPAPKLAENGEPGEIRKIKVELKLLADVGLVGMPSVGKSTIISKVSKAKSKIASYHFTTLSPILGVVKTIDNRSFVMADLPGLIKGASLGEGLGDQFLKHIERTKIIVHVIDISGIEGRDPYEDYIMINKELENFNPKILEKPQIIVANKMDIQGAALKLEKFREKIKIPVYPISAINNEGLDKALVEIANMVDRIKSNPLYEKEKFESHVLYEFKEKKPFTIIKETDAWVIKGEELEKLVRMTRFNSEEAILRFSHQLRRIGIDDKLRELGAEDGDSIKILDLEFEYRL